MKSFFFPTVVVVSKGAGRERERGVPNSWLPAALCVHEAPLFSLLYYSPLLLVFGGCICHLGRSGHHLPPWSCGTSALVFKKPHPTPSLILYVSASVRPSRVARSCSHLNPSSQKKRDQSDATVFEVQRKSCSVHSPGKRPRIPRFFRGFSLLISNTFSILQPSVCLDATTNTVSATSPTSACKFFKISFCN